MPVIGEDFRQTLLPHGLHRNAIHQTLALVGPGAVKLQTKEGFPALGHNANFKVID